MNKKSLLRAGLFSFHIILTIFITYIFLNFISQKISHESDNNVAILTSFYSYIVSSRLSIVEIVEFVLRVFIPFISVLACMFSVIFFKKFNLRDKKFIFLFLCGFCIALQPLMTGPLLTGKNAGRLATLGFVPFLLSLSVLSPLPVFSNLCKFLFIFTVGVGSLHHLYTSPGLSSPTQFVLLQFFCFFTIVLVFAFNNFRINAKNDL